MAINEEIIPADMRVRFKVETPSNCIAGECERSAGSAAGDRDRPPGPL